ncbi:MAG: PIG-L family deacetylase [Chlorogloeopsis fritschii C42_A2020_084]|uniref:PIG-L deacetylase family protein n=1 Tax=Chlorogloeopsis fritschii TaxID=1124 RepID=UPI0019FC207F|nr:PIG-L family deacetylase [Chlorogloeopsis fritschii]MBF2006525.1 PIG-L family deacetylase [Chlorogloeopsis fritschii C42_A2020_084]
MPLQIIYSRILGKLENVWQLIQAEILFRWILPAKSQLLPVSQKPAMVFAPHQDDETFGCGGMIALKRELGVPVKVVFLTDGHKSYFQIKPEDIVQVRKQEATSALNILGVESPEDIYFIDQPDGELRHISSEQQLDTINQLVKLLKSFQPAEVYVPHQKDKHPDHEATYDLVQAALKESGIQAQVFQYPIWLFWKMPPLFRVNLQPLGQSYKLSIKSVFNKKQQAIQVYGSQRHTLPFSFMRRFFLPSEIFFQQEN